MEIGVHHGRLFILLALLTRDDEYALAVDLFDMQDRNVDRSGAGDIAVFRANLARYAPAAQVQILQGDSVELASSIIDDHRGMRYISVDGGHLRSTTASDLRVAEALAVKGAIVSLDDIYRVDWSGVTAGLALYFKSGGRLVPFCLSPNKVHLTTSPEWARTYASRLRSMFNTNRSIEFFDFDDVLSIDEEDRWTCDNLSGIGAPRHQSVEAAELANAAPGELEEMSAIPPRDDGSAYRRCAPLASANSSGA